MKKINRIIAAFLTLLALFCLCSCELPVPEEGDELEDLAEDMIEEILVGNSERVRSCFSADTDLTEFDAVFAEWQTMLADVRDFELEPVGWRKNIKGGVHSFELTCRVQCAVEGLMLRISTVEGEVTGFTFYFEDARVTGGGVTVVNIVLYVLTGLSVALVVFMVMDCAKRKLTSKVLWMILILLGHLELYATRLAEKTTAGFHIGKLVPFSELIAYESGAFEISLILPVGALVYFFLRKRMTEKYEAEQAAKQSETEPAPQAEAAAAPEDAPNRANENDFDVPNANTAQSDTGEPPADKEDQDK